MFSYRRSSILPKSRLDHPFAYDARRLSGIFFVNASHVGTSYAYPDFL